MTGVPERAARSALHALQVVVDALNRPVVATNVRASHASYHPVNLPTARTMRPAHALEQLPLWRRFRLDRSCTLRIIILHLVDSTADRAAAILLRAAAESVRLP